MRSQLSRSTMSNGQRLVFTRTFKLIMLALMVAMLLLTQLSRPRNSAPVQAQTWVQTWSDEFSGAANTLPDPAKWVIENHCAPANNEAQCYTNRTANLRHDGNGVLIIEARKEAYGGRQYTSGRINTQGKFTQTYGRWEARMQLARGTGFWPAFWMLGNDIGSVGWPTSGEIDWMENRGRQPNISSSALHGPGYSGNTPLNHSYTLPAGATDFFSGFHVFAGEWDPTQIRFYVDGVLHYTVNKTDVERYGRWVYDHPHFIILNLAVGGVFDGNQLPPDSAFPGRVLVDYVRVFQRGTGTNPTATNAPQPTQPTSACAPNVARGKAATASSVLGANTAANAVDGNASTRWESSHGVDPGWIRIDLGSSHNICGVRINWEGAYASAYQIQVSNDGTAWTTLRSLTGQNGGIDDNTGLSGSGRYVRIYGTTRGTPYGYSMWELDVYGTAGGTTNPTPTTGGTTCGTANKALNRPATSSSNENASLTPNLAVDGNTGTRWSSAHGTAAQWIRVDLGSTQSICRVQLRWEAAYATAYQIQVSNDGTNFTTVRSLTGQNGGIDDNTGLNTSGRYVRIYATTRATVYGYSLFEFEVY